MTNKVQPYFTLVNHGESTTGVGGYQLFKHDDISGAVKEISKILNEVKDDWWSCIDDIESDDEWIQFNVAVEKLSNQGQNLLTDSDLTDISFECGCYYSVLFAGNTKETLQDILQYLLDNAPNAMFDDEDDETVENEELGDAEIILDDFEDMSLRRRLKIISTIVTKEDNSYLEYLDFISFEDLYCC